MHHPCGVRAPHGAWVANRRAAAAPRRLRWRCRRLAAACPVRLVGDIRHAEAVFHKVFGQENKPGAPVTSSQGARDTNVRPPNRAWEERSIDQNIGKISVKKNYAHACKNLHQNNRSEKSDSFFSLLFPLALLAALRGGRARVHEKEEVK